MSESPIRDPFVSHRADLLAFLNTPAPMPSGTTPVLRGSSRLFHAGHQAVANQGADAAAATRSAVATADVADVITGVGASDGELSPPGSDLFGVDLSALNVEQLGQLMTACAMRMMRVMNRSGESLGT